MCKDHSSFWQLLFLWHYAWPSYQCTSQNLTSPRHSHRCAVSRHCSNHKSLCRWRPAEKLAPTSFSFSFLLSFSGNIWKVLFNHKIPEIFATIPTCSPPSHPENLIPTVTSFSAHSFLCPQSLILKKSEDLAKLYMSQPTRHHFLCNVTLNM